MNMCEQIFEKKASQKNSGMSEKHYNEPTQKKLKSNNKT